MGNHTSDKREEYRMTEVEELINRILTYMRVRFPGCQSWVQRSEDGKHFFIYLRRGDLEKRIAFSAERILLSRNQEAEIDHLGNQLTIKGKPDLATLQEKEMKPESELEAYKRALELIVQQTTMTQVLQYSDFEAEIYVKTGALTTINVLAQNTLSRFEVEEQ